MRIRVIVVGRDRNEPVCQAADDYLKRIRHPIDTEVVELREVPLRKGTAVNHVMAAEGQSILKRVPSKERLIALERSGQTLTSLELADHIRRALEGGIEALNVVIGGPSGLHPSVLDRASAAWSLSALTLPHRIARLVVCEQLYRASAILRGEPYHK